MIYHFNLPYLRGMSGGDKCLLELVRYFVTQKIENTIITTEAGRETFSLLGLEDGDYCKYITTPDYCDSDSGPAIMAGYILRTRRANKLMNQIPVKDSDILFCHNEFFPNYIPFTKLANLHPHARLIYHLHMLAPDLWRGYKGHFSGEFHLPNLRLLHYRTEQRIFRKLVKTSGLIISNNSYYDKTLAQWFPANKRYNIVKYSGVEIPEPGNIEKEYDLAWCGRFHAQKGIDMIPEIIRKIKKTKPNIKIAVIGSGTPRDTRLREAINRHNLMDNIDLLGFLEGVDKFRIMKSARIFLMTSLFESFGQVNLEAMKCGLPVVAYNLPVYGVFERGMIKVPIKDNNAMAAEVIKLLTDGNHYSKIKRDAEEFAAGFSWEKTGEEVLRIMRNNMLLNK